MTKIPTVQFEARKIAHRQSKDGLVVSLLIHPDDVNADFAVAALGTRYMVVLAKIGDDEQAEPIRVQTVAKPANDKPEGYHGPPSDRTKRHWSELSLPEQVGIRCGNEQFQGFLVLLTGERCDDAKAAAQMVRNCCGVASRAEIQPGTEAAKIWAQLEQDFLAATGQMAEQYR